MDTTKYTGEIRSYIAIELPFSATKAPSKTILRSWRVGFWIPPAFLSWLRFLESTYGVRVQDQEMVPENLDSVNRAAAFVASKVSKKAA